MVDDCGSVFERAAADALTAELTNDHVAVPVRVDWVPDSVVASAATTRTGQPIIVLGEQLLSIDRQALFFAAHEAGHVALGHSAFRRRLSNAAILLTLMAAAVSALIALTPFGVWTAPGAALTELVILNLFLRLRVRPAEYAADDFAAANGHSIAGIPEPARWHWWHEILPTHPSWSRRQQRAAAQRRKA